MSFNFMAAVTICSDFGGPENKVTVSTVSPSICHEVMGPDAMIIYQVYTVRSHCPTSLILRYVKIIFIYFPISNLAGTFVIRQKAVKANKPLLITSSGD